MEESSIEKDMEEWELVPSNTTFFDFGLDSEKDLSKELCFDPEDIMNFEYFHCPSENFCDMIEKKQIPHNPIVDKYVHVDVAHEFKDMSYPKSNTTEVLTPPIEGNEKAYRDQDSLKSMECVQEEKFLKSSTLEEKELEKEACVNVEKKGKDLWEGFGLQIWRWKLNGIGALCSIGVTAATTVCILILGSQQRQRQQHQNQKVQFQIYADGERIKQVMQQASRLNQTLSSMRSVPTSAQISFRGNYDAL